ncbi:hypothetical protein PJK45_00880 [Mycobacterium kansasii]|uniref:Uncharacterized protein n=2 Tax=Mycobacterium kansasii TaxID=1768 RepID=A0A1V3XXL6_MYCKA|nr:hypothetical protein [Mycobacterium kansasii]EUA21624.1 hypothetical protein I545_0135 [Mycobacterium kansasii 662]KEP43720.1 hypothetical protein MKSMC1_10840 [Mycobacterium kansasii]MXO36404.1 hypothetical protein [Mycobacterium kansasii]OOK83221.1 hypothetical protein BZL29_0149 [Mycobacterium kansasii]UCA18039.1 hypothetical protein LA359_17390 [Mycobacterium kansasii]
MFEPRSALGASRHAFSLFIYHGIRPPPDSPTAGFAGLGAAAPQVASGGPRGLRRRGLRLCHNGVAIAAVDPG